MASPLAQALGVDPYGRGHDTFFVASTFPLTASLTFV